MADRRACARQWRAALALLALLTVSCSPLATRGGTSSIAPPLRAVRGHVIAIDPGHNGGNWTHPREINRLVYAGTLYKPCDTTGTATAAGYTEAAYNFDVARRLAAYSRVT